jgi:hypothetical protein
VNDEKNMMNLLNLKNTMKMNGKKKTMMKALIKVETKMSMKKGIEANPMLNMKLSMNMKENMNEHESHDECEQECEDEAEYDAANGNETLSICWSPRRPNQSRGGGGNRRVRMGAHRSSVGDAPRGCDGAHVRPRLQPVDGGPPAPRARVEIGEGNTVKGAERRRR